MRANLGRALLWVLTLLTTTSYAQNDNVIVEATKRELIAAETEMEKGVVARDEAILRKRIAEDFVSVHGSSGSRDPSMVPSIVTGKGTVAVAAAITGKYDREVKLIGRDGALMIETVNMHIGGRSQWSTTVLVWRKVSNTWKLVYRQSTPIGEGVIETPEILASYDRLAGEYRRSDGGRWNAGPSLDLSIRKEGTRLLLVGLFGQRDRQDPMIPQGGLEFQVSRFRVKFALDEPHVSLTAVQMTMGPDGLANNNGKVVWTATKNR